ncbi:hypothetical protein QYM36_016540 [Artemia franciscana]|uniref:Endonuclease/exonuclease/phosphatase domain-containing protein n=1 Tax=Artemia franciscana TaxID=6661 RepID=A0AA88HGC8_ARTSF|nr:hypothetical protein QYM36_016540 [Artemia franciscana]
MLSKSASRALTKWTPINERIIVARFTGRQAKLTVVACYAPTNEADDTTKDNFYNTLQAVAKDIPSHDLVCFVGDFNAKVGSDKSYCPEVLGSQGLGEINENGILLVDFALTNDLIIGGTQDVGSLASFSQKRPLLVILDRDIDLATCLHHTWTYQALIADVLDYKSGLVVVKERDENNGYEKKITWELNNDDKFLIDQKGSAILFVVEVLQQERESFIPEYEKVTRLKETMTEGEVDLACTNRQITTAVSSLPQLLEKKKRIEMYTSLAILYQVKARHLDVYFESQICGPFTSLIAHGHMRKKLLSKGGPKTVRSRLMLDSLGPSSGGANPRLTEAGSMSIFSAPYTVTESTVPVAKVANITPTLSTSGSLAAIRDEKDNLTDFVHCSMLSSIQQSENQFRLSLASHGTVAPSTCNSHSVISILEPGSNNNKIQHENPFTAAYQLFEQNQENLQISSEASQNDKTNVAEPTSLGQGSLSRKLVRSAVSPETLTEIPTIQKQNSEGALNTDNVNQRISVFEPLNMRDTVQHFCEKHLDSIKSYMERVSAKIPLPVKCTIQERKSKKYVRVHFVCHKRGNCCLYANNFFFFETKHPRLWIHLMFLNLQARSDSALSTRDASVNALKTCWDILEHDNKSFVALVMSAFPSAKLQSLILSYGGDWHQ